MKKDTDEGLFNRQPELNPNPQFMLVLGKGQFSQKWVNSGMLVDERPYENTGAYLYNKAPQQYNEAKIKGEKENYIKKYVDTNGSGLAKTSVGETFQKYIDTKNLVPNTAVNTMAIYQEFEALAGYSFPDDLKALFDYHNGIPETGFLSTKEVLVE